MWVSSHCGDRPSSTGLVFGQPQGTPVGPPQRYPLRTGPTPVHRQGPDVCRRMGVGCSLPPPPPPSPSPTQPRQSFLMFSVKWCQLPSGVSLLTLGIYSPFSAHQDVRNRTDPFELWWLLCPGHRLRTPILCSIAFLVSFLPAHRPVKDGGS